MFRRLRARIKNIISNQGIACSAPELAVKPPGEDWLDQSLGQIKRGEISSAAESARRRLAGDSRDAAAQCVLGMAEAASRNHSAAIDRFKRAIAIRPDFAHAHNVLGLSLCETGQIEAALGSFQRAVECRHDYVEAHLNLGRLLAEQGRSEEAADCYQLALAFDDGAVEARIGLARLKRKQRDFAAAERELRAAAARAPERPELFFELGLVLEGAGDIEGAIDAYRAALECNVEYAEAGVNLGVLLMHHRGDSVEAERLFHRALRVRPAMSEARANLGLVLHQRGQFDEALAYHERLVREHPEIDEFRWNRGLALLALGEFARGWEDYELRKRRERGAYHREFPFAEWEGGALDEATILVYGEQGLGDEIMFASCLPDLLAKARGCVIECHARLESIFRRSFPTAAVHGALRDGRREWLQGFREIQVQSAIGSLPRFLRRGQGDFPSSSGYLKADPARVASWRSRLAALGDGPKIGISWRGGGVKTQSGLRSLPLDEWQPVLTQSGCHFVSLQYGECSEELATQRLRGIDIHHYPEAVSDLEEMAALVTALDLVLSVANTTVHLAGSLGQRVWVLLTFCPDWRYRWRGDRMLWYPSAHLFRQPRPRDWPAVIERVAMRLRNREISAGQSALPVEEST